MAQLLYTPTVEVSPIAIAVTTFDILGLWLHGKSPHSQKSYRRDVLDFITFVGGRDLDQVTLNDLQQYVNILGSQSYKPATINRKLAALKSLYTFCNKAGILKFNPTTLITLETVKNTLAERILSESEVLTMIALTTKERDQVLIRLLYASGGRVAEIVGLTWRDVKDRGDFGQVTLLGKGGKTRTVVISKDCLRSLNQLRGDGSLNDPIFKSRKGNKAITTTQALRIVKDAAKRAKIEGNVSPHWLRHSHCSHALERGASIKLVQESMGHSSLTITERYLHSNPSDGSGLYLVV